MAQWTLLREFLKGVGPSVQLSWSELDKIVGGLPPSAERHRAWWSGDRPHVRAWRSAGFTIGDLVMGHGVTFVRTDAAHKDHDNARVHDRSGTRQPAPEVASGDALWADIVLVTCVKTKLGVPAAAKDLYISALFKRERAYAERQGVPWFILSAEHGLVAPDEWLAPYERYLPDTSATYRAAWGNWVAARLELVAGPLTGKRIEVHAGSPYIDAIADHLMAKHADLLNPLNGLTLGGRLQWYDAAATSPDLPELVGDSGDSHADASRFVEMLLDRSGAVTPSQFLDRKGAGLKEPGLYSWWVDDAGAADLSKGLELPVSAGLIYAGLAGATRWPSGKPSTNTLWSRIGGMHLGGRHDFSTFRRTLGSVLANTEDDMPIDEGALTDWMGDHLKVLAVPYPDADTLGRLEDDVLRSIDPPLNLKGMATSPVRLRLKELRRRHS